ncbi:hypothetical protein BX257_5761 [Streptomyces sp. 3212.3]|nr:hypothetical protein BX257_5761 [Streptomyces sp. 3212.3]
MQLGARLDEGVQGDEQRGGARVGTIDVDAHGDGLLDGRRDLPGGGERPVRGLLAHPGQLPQLVPTRPVDVPDGGESGRLDRPDPEPALGDVLQPADGDLRQFPGDEFRPQRRESRPHRVQRSTVLAEQGMRGVVQPRAVGNSARALRPADAAPFRTVPTPSPPRVRGPPPECAHPSTRHRQRRSPRRRP